MLIPLRSKRRFIFLSILALLYFAVGAYAAHPHFHKRTAEVHEHVQLNHTEHSLHPHFKEQNSSDNHSCLICDFFVTNIAHYFGDIAYTPPFSPEPKGGLEYIKPLIYIFHPGFPIRGPPATPHS